MLVSGTFSTVIMKTEYAVRSHGTATCVDPQTGEETTLCPFAKPWFGVLQMKVAMTLCLAFLYMRKCSQHRQYLETPVLRMHKGGRRYVATAPSEEEMVAIKRKYAGHAGAENKVEALKRKYQPHRNEGANEQSPLLAPRLLGGEEYQQGRVSLRTLAAIALPSLLDLLQTVLCNVGLLWISSSVFQMARGSIIIFSAFFSVRLMGKKLYGYHYASIWIVMLAVALVGYAGVGHHSTATAADDADAFNAVLGLFFIIAAQILCALQIVVEEHMMLALNVSPMLLVGFEGLWGLVFYIVLVPILTLSPATGSAFATTWHEDFVDSFVQVKNSPALIVLILAYIVAVGTLNVTGNYVTKHLSAVMRSITETLRTLGVWMFSLFVYYVVQWQGSASPGEEWTTYSWLELLGFLLMVYGTLAWSVDLDELDDDLICYSLIVPCAIHHTHMQYKRLIHLPVAKLYAAEQRERGDAVKSPFMGNMHK
ncbi:Nucleotide-sugar transporter [Phytophthora cactorum]|nr:Nucleotide-sugar transporter [Phytophthora cactorum]